MRAAVSSVLAGILAGAILVGPGGLGAPGHAQPAPDVEHAKDLYTSAEAAMRDARYADAIRDYGAAYEITKDPAFFYKIGSANEHAGTCDVALIYYRRYLKEGRPSDEFAKLTAARIQACGGDPAAGGEPGDGSAAKPGTGTGTGPTPGPEPTPGAGSATPGTGSAATSGAGSPPPGAGSAAAAPRLGRHKGPWLLVGGSIAFVTMGAVLAYSADAAERDVKDLYVGLNGTPPPFNDGTRRRYDDAIAEGRRYQALSIGSFSVAGALAIGAAVWFALDKDVGEKLTVTPAVAPGTAGVSTTIRF